MDIEVNELNKPLKTHSRRNLTIQNMTKKYEGFLAPHGLYILNTQSGEVRFIAHESNVPITASASISNDKLDSRIIIPTQANQLSPFETEVMASYPYLIAKPFSNLLKETDARMKCKLMVDTFTAVLKYLALQLASEYLRAKDLKDIQIHQTLTKDLSRPLISAWNLLIARCLPVMKDNKIELFSPELKVAYEKLESKCKDPLLVTQSYSDENGEIKTKTKKLGKIQALINYRNGLAHGFTQSQTRAQKEFDEYYPLLCDILQEVRFVSRYTLWHVESSREGVNGIRLMGASPSLNKVDFDRDGVNPAISPLFLINDSTGEILPLYAFFDVDETNENGLPEIGKDVFVFEGNTKSTVIYLSSSGEHLEKSSRFQHWKELLAQKQMDVEWADKKNLTLDTLHSIGKHISASGIQALIASAKYLREATIPRQDLNELLDSFSYGDFNGFVLGGESGIGKSTLLAQKTEEWHSDGHMVTFYRGSALNQSDIANKFLRDCALKLNYFEDFLSVVHPVISQTDKKCYLIVDALNEYAGDLNELIKSVENMVAQSSNFPWFKLIVSIRDSAYNRVTERFGELIPKKYFTVEEEKGGEKVQTNIIRLQPVTKDFVEQLYNAYRDFKWKDNTDSVDEGYYIFRPLTEFNELDVDGSTVKLIRSPLMARLVMRSFHRAKLPHQLTNDDALRLYQDNIVLEKSDNSIGFPERKKLLTLLVIELDKHNSQRIERDNLIQHNAIRPYLINNQRDSAYIQLLDLGVLMEEWEADNCYIRFAFDKFFEFLLADLHWIRINDKKQLFELCQRSISYKILQGATEIVIQRLCTNNQYEIFIDLLDLTDSSPEEEKTIIKEIYLRVLHSISIENNTLFRKILDLLPEKPSQFDLEILVELVEKFKCLAQVEEFRYTSNVTKKEALLLNNQKVYSDMLLLEADLFRIQSEVQQATIICKEIKTIKKHINDDHGLCKLYIEMAWLDRSQDRFVEAMIHAKNALKIATKENFDKLKVDIYNIIGILHEKSNKRVEAIKAYDKALEIAKSLNDKIGVARILNNKGNIIEATGDLQTAEIMYLESCSILEQVGDMRRLSIVFSNIGDINFKKYKYDISQNYHRKSLEIKTKLGNKRGISISLGNLALNCFQLRNDAQAKQYFIEAIKIQEEMNNQSGVIRYLHRAYSIFNKSEKRKYYELLKKIEKFELFPGEEYIILDIYLIYNCQSRNYTSEAIVKSTEEIIDIISKLEKIENEDIDDLPIDAFYIAANKLIELNSPVEAKVLSKQALNWIGDRKTRRKEELERIYNLTP
jgi:tetratricopeptide (TPR) repeat protein